MSGHCVPASECFATLGADKGSRDKVGIVVSLEVHVEELLLAEGFITMATGIRLFSSMGPFVHDHVPLLSAGVITLVTFEALLILVGLLMLDEGIPLMEHSITVATLLALLNVGMLLPQVDTQVTLSRYNSITVRAVEFGHILRVLLQNVHLHGTALSEASMADVTFIWLLSGVGPHVPLQFVGVSAGIAAQAALERAFSGV